MSLMDFVAIPDNFEFQEQLGGFDFPCCVCAHRGGSDSSEPAELADTTRIASQKMTTMTRTAKPMIAARIHAYVRID
mgnify:CR=1 FL=1